MAIFNGYVKLPEGISAPLKFHRKQRKSCCFLASQNKSKFAINDRYGRLFRYEAKFDGSPWNMVLGTSTLACTQCSTWQGCKQSVTLSPVCCSLTNTSNLETYASWRATSGRITRLQIRSIVDSEAWGAFAQIQVILVLCNPHGATPKIGFCWCVTPITSGLCRSPITLGLPSGKRT